MKKTTCGRAVLLLPALALAIGVAAVAVAQNDGNPQGGGRLRIQETDTDPSGGVRTLNVTNGTLTDDGGGTWTLDVTGSVAALSDLSDVATLTTQTAGQLLTFNVADGWRNEDAPAAEGLTATLVVDAATGGTSISVTTGDDIAGVVELDLVSGGAGDITLDSATGSVLVAAGDSVSTARLTEDVTASPNALTAAESWKVLTDIGSSGTIEHDLPAAAAAGIVFTFTSNNANRLTVDPGDNDAFILAGVTFIDGEPIDLRTAGASVTVVSNSAANWDIVNVEGVWNVDVTEGLGGKARPISPVVYEAHTGADTLGATETGSVHSNLGDGDTLVLGLPAQPPAGTTFTFVRHAAFAFRVDPDTSDSIDWSSSQSETGEYVELQSQGATLTVVFAGGNIWLATEEFGTLAEED